MKNHLKLVAILLFVIISIGAFLTDWAQMGARAAVALPPAQAPQQEKTAEQVYKNIQVLRGVPASQLQGAMSFIADSLGVGCGYCHTKSFDADDKPTKQTARKMMRMVFDLNKGNREIFNGTTISCYTCHRGKSVPISVPVIARGAQRADAPPPLAKPDD